MKYLIFFCIFALIINQSQSTVQDNLHLIATMTGEKAGDEFSIAARAGDVNGDGYDDVLVGSAKDYVKLYFGGTPFDTVADLRFVGKQRSLFGYHLDGAGDVNGDGFDDIIIGATAYGFTGLGKAYLYFGGNNMDTIPDFEFTGKYGHHYVGSTVTGAGDVNSDGFDDFMIGASFGLGRMYLFFGGSRLDTIPSITLVSDKGDNFFGDSGCGGGDINSDGFDDVIVGAPGFGADSGRVVIYYGGTEMDSVADVILYNKDVSFGKTCVNSGDVNGDGISDFLITSLKNAYLYIGIGTCFVIHSDPIMGFGGDVNVGGSGDINNDGFDEFIIGNTNYKNKNDVMVGLVWGYYGSALFDTLHDFSLEGDTKWSEFSKNIIVADLNGDYFDEVIVGSPGFPDYQNPLGKVYIYSYTKIDCIDNRNQNQNKPEGFQLFQNYPNPFNLRTRIDFMIDQPDKVHLAIYAPFGHLVETLINIKMNRGWHSIFWEANELPSGLYLCRLSTETYSDIIKLLLIK